MDTTYDFVYYLAQRYAQADGRQSRRWFNEGKMLILWSWLLVWTNGLKDGDDCTYTAWCSTRKKHKTWKELKTLAHGTTSLRRLVQYRYLKKLKYNTYSITRKGQRCAYEMALRVLKKQERERPNDLWLQDFANWYEIYDLNMAWMDGCKNY